MGLELLERPILKDSVAKSAQIPKTLGCEWDAVAELTMGKDESRLGVLAISQPICIVFTGQWLTLGAKCRLGSSTSKAAWHDGLWDRLQRMPKVPKG